MIRGEYSLEGDTMRGQLEGSDLERALSIQRMYEEFDDCRHLIADVFDYGRNNGVRSYHMEVALELAYSDYLDKMSHMPKSRRSDEAVRRLKVGALTQARDYLADMVNEQGSE